MAGWINASGAGFFGMEQTLHGGFQVNAVNTGGFAFLVGFSGFTDDHFLNTTINSASVYNFIQAGVEQMVISTGTATGTSTAKRLQGKACEMTPLPRSAMARASSLTRSDSVGRMTLRRRRSLSQ